MRRFVSHTLISAVAMELLCSFVAAYDAAAPTLTAPPVFKLSPAAPLAGVLRFSTDRPCTASVAVVEGQTRESVPVDPKPTREHHISVLGLRADRDYALHILLIDEDRTTPTEPVTFRTAPLPDDFPSLQLTRAQPERMEPGVTLFSLFRWDNDLADNSFGVFAAVDAGGEVVWYYRIGSPAAALHVLPDGDFQFIHGVPPKFIRRIDRLGNLIQEYQAVALGDELYEAATPVDVDTFHHDFAALAEGGLLALTTEVRRLERYPPSLMRPRQSLGPANVVGDVVVEIASDGRVANRWSLLDILDPQRITYGSHDSFWDYRGYGHIPGGTKDWSHANAVIRDPRDGGLVVSLRHQDAVVKIDPQTSEVKWILGTSAGWQKPLVDKVLKPTSRLEWPFHQHGVKFTPHGTLLMYDNGNLRAIPPARPLPPTESYSRAVEFEIDEQAMSVRQVWSHGGPGSRDRFYSPFLCDADWLPQTGNVLITDGARVTDNNGQPVNDPPGKQQWARLVEVTHDSSPQIVWELQIDDRQTRPEVGWSVYRAARLPSLYPESSNRNDPGPTATSPGR